MEKGGSIVWVSQILDTYVKNLRASISDRPSPTDDGTPPNPSTIDVMVGSPSKKQTRARDMLQSLGNLFLVRLVIYNEFERV